LQQRVQVAVCELKHEIEEAVFLHVNKLAQADDVLVAQFGQRRHLAQAEALVPAWKPGFYVFDGDNVARAQAACSIHRAEAAIAHSLEHRVSLHFGPDHNAPVAWADVAVMGTGVVTKLP
jgi:hypothetical protein